MELLQLSMISTLTRGRHIHISFSILPTKELPSFLFLLLSNNNFQLKSLIYQDVKQNP